jgi:GNAT superfamily N-acetyltransferase
MPLQVEISRMTGERLRDIVPELAQLRVCVFRAWPYLYEGDEAYEAAYLQTYVRSPRAAVIVARAAGRIVGASTCLPLGDETENVTAPFRARGWELARFFYFGESVLLPAFRGQGVGVAFFAEREGHARAVSACDYAVFCAVQRPSDHPARPAGYQPLDSFWSHRGFVRRPDLKCEIGWKDVGDAEETDKTLVFWMKSLGLAPLPPAREG